MTITHYYSLDDILAIKKKFDPIKYETENPEKKNIKTIIEKIIKNHNCFNTVLQTQTHNYHTSQYKNRYPYNKNYHKKDSKENSICDIISTSRRTRDFVRKNDEQIIYSLLNKLSEKNYKTISESILKIVNENNIDLIYGKICEFAYKQPLYVNIYIDIIRKIYELRNAKITAVILNSINNLNFGEATEIIEKPELNIYVMSEDEFCDYNKRSDIIRGKFLFIGKLVDLLYLEINHKEFRKHIDYILNLNNLQNEIYLDCLNIINNVMRLSDEYIAKLQKYANPTNFKGKMKLYFRLMSIIENNEHKLVSGCKKI